MCISFSYAMTLWTPTSVTLLDLPLNVELFNSLRQTELDVKQYVLSKEVKQLRTVKEYKKNFKTYKTSWAMENEYKKNSRLRSEEYIGVGGKPTQF